MIEGNKILLLIGSGEFLNSFLIIEVCIFCLGLVCPDLHSRKKSGECGNQKKQKT
ncbi:hypothetical protein D3C75_756740 [compost metagenome]